MSNDFWKILALAIVLGIIVFAVTVSFSIPVKEGKTEPTLPVDRSFEYYPYGYSTQVIDSCEYLVLHYSATGTSITHKGNCKYCQQRLLPYCGLVVHH